MLRQPMLPERSKFHISQDFLRGAPWRYFFIEWRKRDSHSIEG